MGAPAMATAELELQMPIARFRRSSGYATRSRASVLGIKSAPKAPCNPRRMMTPTIDPTTPTPTEARANPTTPTKKMRFRPKRSPSRPPTMSRTASVSR